MGDSKAELELRLALVVEENKRLRQALTESGDPLKVALATFSGLNESRALMLINARETLVAVCEFVALSNAEYVGPQTHQAWTKKDGVRDMVNGTIAAIGREVGDE